MELALLGRPQ
jgi:hypothetical protein